MRKKNGARGINLSDLRLYYKARVIKTVWHWHKKTDQWNKIESPEIKPMHLWMSYFLTKEARIHNGAKIASSISGAGKTGHLCVKEEIRTLPKAIHKISSKDLNVRHETIKLLEANTGKTLDDINQSKILLYDPPSRVKEVKPKINQWNLIKLKSFYTERKLQTS